LSLHSGVHISPGEATMVTEQELQSLAEFESDTTPVLSLYLNVDSTQKPKEEYRLALRSMLRQLADRRPRADVQAVERFLDHEYDGSARGLVFFSCQAQGLWQVLPFAVPVPDRAVLARRPFISPIRDMLDRYGRHMVVLVEREGARLFLFELGQLQEVKGTLGDELKKHKQGGRSAPRLQRRADAVAQQNLLAVVKMTKDFCESTNCGRLILGGTTENVALFRSMLPQSLRDSIVGEITMDTWASEKDVRDRAAAIADAHTAEQDQTLIEQMLTAAMGGAGVTGLDETLIAFQQERIQTLVVADGYEASGVRCTYCDYLGLTPLDECPYCGSPARRSDNVVGTIVSRAIGKGITVKIVSGSAPLHEAGDIGAMLRY
jgi:peptide chain release factor subunit 1